MGYTAIVDYGVGNLKSVANALAYLGQRTVVTGEAQGLERADAVILPGVGAFPDAADKLLQTGLDRVLRRPAHFAQCLGRQVDVKLYRPVDGRKEFTGALSGYEDGAVLVDGIRFEKNDVAQVRLHVEF